MNLKKLLLTGLACLALTGCMSVAKRDAKIQEIYRKHGVEVKADNPLSRCYLFGNLPALLDRIDEDLEASPEYFKRNLGQVKIEETFIDNFEIFPYPGIFLAGYVNLYDKENRYPIHVKNRSLLEKVLLFIPRENELFLEEAAHSFLFNAVFNEEDTKPAEKFFKVWEEANKKGLPHMPLLTIPLDVLNAFPPVCYIRLKSMPCWGAIPNHIEDIAKSYCYLRRHGNVEFLKQKDPVLYEKCIAVKEFAEGKVE